MIVVTGETQDDPGFTYVEDTETGVFIRLLEHDARLVAYALMGASQGSYEEISDGVRVRK